MLGLNRAGLHRIEGTAAGRWKATDPPWTERLREWIQQYPTFGYRRLWVLLRCRNGVVVNRKAVYRVLEQKGWFVHQRVATPRPRVQGWMSRASRSNERWAMDVTHIPCGQDGWAHLAAVIDCHDREVIGYELALRSRAKKAGFRREEICRLTWREVDVDHGRLHLLTSKNGHSRDVAMLPMVQRMMHRLRNKTGRKGSCFRFHGFTPDVQAHCGWEYHYNYDRLSMALLA